jgi:hypothetical protein
MSSHNTSSDTDRLKRIVDEAMRNREQKEKGYRARALKLFPPICAHCGREFEGKRIRELTVHHKDHNHDNNPPDGSNWELLCTYCHENEHARQEVADAYDKEMPGAAQEETSSFRPFANLDALLKSKKNKGENGVEP